MNWSNVYRIEWKKDADGKHRVCYRGSRGLPAPYVGEGAATLTDDELRVMYLSLRREEKRGIPTAWAGHVVTATRPRTILGLDEVEKYFKEERMKKENERTKEKVMDLEVRVKELEAVVMDLLKAIVIKDDNVTQGAVVKENGDGAGQDGKEK